MSDCHNFTAFIDPEIGIPIVIWLGWAMVVLGLFKIVIYGVGEWKPTAWDWIKSPTFKSFFIGKGNRLLFGLGGGLTVILGLGSVGIAYLLRYLMDRL